MFNYKNLFLASTLLWQGSTALSQENHKGIRVGNGGDTIRCLASEANELEGLYTLDYLLTYMAMEHTQLASINSWDDSKNRILRKLKLEFPELYKSFHYFTETIGYSGIRRYYSWYGQTNPLIDIDDELILSNLPDNCKNEDGSLIQAVIRVPRSGGVDFEYDRNLINELKDHPLQYSFLMVHEWLWNFFLPEDIHNLRRVNYYLHSLEFEEASKSELHGDLEHYGLDYKRFSRRFTPVCQRSLAIRNQFEEIFRDSCEFIDANLMQAVLDRDYKNTGILLQDLSQLQVNDLVGLGHAVTISIENSELDLNRFHFKSLFSLDWLTFYNSTLTFTKDTFTGKRLRKLKIIQSNLQSKDLTNFVYFGTSLKLNHNNISDLNFVASSNMPNIRILEVSSNDLEEVGDIFTMLPKLSHLNLGMNPRLTPRPEFWTGLSRRDSVTELDLSGTALVDLDLSQVAIEKPSVQRLYLRDIPFEDYPKGIEKLITNWGVVFFSPQDQESQEKIEQGCLTFNITCEFE